MTRANRMNNVISALILVLLVLLLLQSFTSRVATQTVLLGVLAGLMAVVVMQSARWSSDASIEYKTVQAGTLDESALQQFGKEGWRLICLDASNARYIFTR